MTSVSKKVCLLGDFAVGKTSLVRRFVYNLFDDKYISTIGVKVSRKIVSAPVEHQLVELTMMLWDLAGSEEFNQVRASYLRGAAGAMLVCDLTRPETIQSLQTYIRDLRTVSPQARLIVAANKADLIDPGQPLYQEFMGQLSVLADGFDLPCYLTSAKTGAEVETVFRHLGQLLLSE